MKTCKHEGCSYPVFGKGYCKSHQYLRGDIKKKINPVSNKRKEGLKEYSVVRKQYLSEHKNCEVVDCKRKATEIHHKRSRIGELLTNPKWFLAVCRPCHTRIELNPLWAKENGYSESR